MTVKDVIEETRVASRDMEHRAAERGCAAGITLGVCGNAVALRDGVWHTHHSFGRMVDLLAQRVAGKASGRPEGSAGLVAGGEVRLRYYGPVVAAGAESTCDFPLASHRFTVCPWGERRNSLRALRRPDRLVREYSRMVRECDLLLMRGSGPLLWTVHVLARRRGRRVVHCIVGNPPAVMRAARRGYGGLTHLLGRLFARCEQRMTRIGAWVSRAHLLVNGAELARIFASERTTTVVASTITDDDFFVRPDTCLGETIRVLFVGFVRPEKGLEYLVRAVSRVDCDRPLHLAIVGPWNQFSTEHERIVRLIDDLGLANRVSWEGYASFGSELFDQMDRSDMLVLPSLSEGTPHVLAEARARSLPVIASRVGGIPSSVSDKEDGLLVEPRDAEGLAVAIGRIIRDGQLRRTMIRTGRKRARAWTVDRFLDLVCERLTGERSDGGMKPRSDGGTKGTRSSGLSIV